ncbi:MAG: two-component regulator propeller domain-containing protein [Vicinamibacterales bacterium]
MQPIFFCLILAILALAPARAGAADSTDGSLDYSVAAWDRNSGLPTGGITALMAAADGSIWVGMDSGLFRFDGLRFVRVGDSRSVTHLKAARDGSIWVALGDGSISRIKVGQTTRFDQSNGLPGVPATALFEDTDGLIWVGTRRGLYALTGNRWELSTAQGLPESPRVTGATVDRQGNVLLSTNNTLFRRDRGTNAFVQLAAFDTPGSANGICSVTPDRVYVTDPSAGFAVVGRAGGPTSPSRSVGLRILCDKRDNVWIGTGGGGLWRIPPVTSASSGPRVITGMLGEIANALAEDDRGNIWVGTPAGLTRLTPNPMVRLADLGVSTAIEATEDGHLWVGSLDGLIELVASGSGVREYQRRLPGLRIRALHADRRGALWIGSERGIARLDVATRTITEVPTGDRPLRQVDSISSGMSGDIWIADGDQGVLRWNGTQLTRVPLPFDLRENQVNVVHVDRAGRVWLALERGVAVIQVDGRADVFLDAGRGHAGRRSRSIMEDSRGVIWIGGIDSLAWFSGERHHVVTQADGFPIDVVKGLEEDATGDLWIAADAAIVHVSRAEFDRVEKGDRSTAVHYSQYDPVDGAGVPRLLGDRSVTKAPNGMLWFITGNGITGIDPRLPSFNDATVPQASVVTALADGTALDLAAGSHFSSRTRAVQIDYSALDTSSPHRTRFRYRLRGFDDKWQDAGARLTAFYTNLPPGQYDFEVTASNQINVWGAPTAAWRFSVDPVFYQTRWFPLACAGLVALAGWGIWRLRLAQVRQQFNIVLGERVRLSREIHDTLLQSLVGVAVQCEVLARDVEKHPGNARETLTRLRRQVEGHIREFRQAVSDLRAERDDFISALRTAGETAERTAGVQFDLVVRGRPRQSPEEVERQLIKIAREAVSNAARHSRARSISVEVGYDESSLRLAVRDDGLGFDPDTSVSLAEGHCGLTTMRERAAEIGARLSISSAFGQGTQVEAIVPLSPA